MYVINVILLGLSKGKNSNSVTIGPSTVLTRRFTTDLRVKYAMATPQGTRGCHQSWDDVLGERWDVLPGTGKQSLDTAIRTMRFQEVRDFGFTTVKCHLNTTDGHFAVEEDYH